MVKVSSLVKKRIPKRPRLQSKKNFAKDKDGKTISYFHLRATDEFFTNYEDYSYKLSLLGRPIWECELTGTSNLTYWQARELDQIVEALIIQRLPPTLRAEFLSLPLPEIESEKIRKAQLVANATQMFSSTFFPGELVRVKIPNTKTFKDGEIICEADVADIPPPTEPNSETENEKAPFKAYRVKLVDVEEAQVFDAAFIKTGGLLKNLKLIPLRTLLTRWASGMPICSEVRKGMKAGVPTQPGLTVEIPAKVAIPQRKRKAASFLGPSSSVMIGGVFVSPGLLAVVNQLTTPTLGSTSNGPPQKQRKFDEMQKKAKESKAKEEAVTKLKEIESAIKYPTEDLDVPRILPKSKAKRPGFHILPKEDVFCHIIKVWTFLATFGEFIGVARFPLLDLHDSLVDACSKTGKDRFPIEHLVKVLLEFVCTDADIVTNLYIPDGINDILTPSEGYSIRQIGDWRKSKIPVPNEQWGCVLLSCIKELHCPETLPRGQAIIDHLEAEPVNQVDPIHFQLVQANFKKAGLQLDSKINNKSKSKPEAKMPSNLEKSSTSLRRSARSNPTSEEKKDGEEEDEEKDESETLEEDPEIRAELEPLVQQQFYSLSADDKLQLFDFLIEQALGTTKFKSYHEETYTEISDLRRDRQDHLREARAFQDKALAMRKEIELLQEDLKTLDGDSPQPDPTDSASSTETPIQASRNSRSSATTRRKVSALKQIIQKKNEELNSLECLEDKQIRKAESLTKKMEESSRLLRFRHLGEDRFYNRYYFIRCLDGPIILVETAHPSLLAQLTTHPIEEIEAYHKEITGTTKTDQLRPWGYYSKSSEIDALLSWLCTKGIREKALKAALESVHDRFPVDPK